MMVKAWVEFAQEVEVEVSIADVMATIEDLSEDDQPGMVLDCINRCYGVLRRVTDAQIGAMNDKQRAVIQSAMHEQAARYLPAAPSPLTSEPDKKSGAVDKQEDA